MNIYKPGDVFQINEKHGRAGWGGGVFFSWSTANESKPRDKFWVFLGHCKSLV